MNRIPSESKLRHYRCRYPAGTRIQLDADMDDPQPISAGTKGTIMTRCSVNIGLTGDMNSIGLGYNNYFCKAVVKLGETANINNDWGGGISSKLENSFIQFTGDPLLENYPTTEYARYGGIRHCVLFRNAVLEKF